MNFATLLSYALPPLVGAVIGFITNAIAIKMLFRPHSEWRLFGIRVPFTPGIIPRRRGQLAESIGRMVSDELLTPETLLQQTSSESFISGIAVTIEQGLKGILAKDLGSILSSTRDAVEEAGRSAEELLDSDSNGSSIRELLSGIVSSEKFRELLGSFIGSGLDFLAERRIAEFLGDDNHGFSEALSRYVQTSLGNERQQRRLITRLRYEFRKATAENRELTFLANPALAEQVSTVVRIVFPSIASIFVTWLRSRKMHVELERHGRVLLRRILDRLTAFQKLFVVAAQYDKQIDAKIPGIVDDTIDSVETLLGEAETAEQLGAAIAAYLKEIGGIGTRDIVERFGAGSAGAIDKAIARIVERIFARESGAFRQGVRALLTPLETRTIGELISGIVSTREIAKLITSVLCDRIGGLLENRNGTIDPPRLMPTGFAETTIGELISPNDTMLRTLSIRTARVAVDLINRRIPGILETVDVRSLVEDKINGLRVDQVEALLMRVLQKHLKWINVFGAILGFILGALQILMRVFG